MAWQKSKASQTKPYLIVMMAFDQSQDKMRGLDIFAQFLALLGFELLTCQTYRSNWP